MTLGYPTLWVWCRKIVETSKTCKILLYFRKWQICPLFVSRPNTYEWVSESLKCTKVAVNDFVGCISMQNQKFYSKKLFRTPTKFCYVFWEMTTGYPTWCRVGRDVLSRNDKLLLGEKSPSTYLGIIERGTDTIGFGQKLPLVELSQVTAAGGSPSTYICRNKHDCIWTKLPWVELS